MKLTQYDSKGYVGFYREITGGGGLEEEFRGRQAKRKMFAGRSS